MKIATRGRYSLRMMLDLPLHDEYSPSKMIAQRQEVSNKYWEQIITVLSRAGFVKSIRDPRGGYKLVKPTGEYTVGMILRQIEGSLVPVACMGNHSNQCPCCGICAALDAWQEIDEAVSNVVDHITLEDLAKQQRQKLQDKSEV